MDKHWSIILVLLYVTAIIHITLIMSNLHSLVAPPKVTFSS